MSDSAHCTVSFLASEALAIIKRRDEANDAELARLIELEEEAIKHAPKDRLGLVYQAAMITMLVDSIEAAVPEDSQWAAQSSGYLRAIDRISRSIMASLVGTSATENETALLAYYLPELPH